MSVSREDQQPQRYLDGELSESEAATFAAQMLSDNELRQRVDAMRQAQAGFASVRDGDYVVRAPANFTASVMGEVRRLPGREQLRQLDVAESTVSLCRRLLLAAALLFGLGFAYQSGLLRSGGAATVEAAPGDIQDEIQRLDTLIMESMEGPRRGK